MIGAFLKQTCRKYGLAFLIFPLILFVAPDAMAAKSVHCSDGDHFVTDIKDIAIKYQATGIEATLNGLAVLRVALNPKTLQQAAVGTQKMNEVLKAMVVGFNSCAISKQQFNEGMKLLFREMKGDAGQLEVFRKEVLSEKKIDSKRFERLEKRLQNYEQKLQKLYKISGKEIDYERITAIVEEIVAAEVRKQIEDVLKRLVDLERINDATLKRLADLDRMRAERPLPTPAEVQVALSETKKLMLLEVEEAEKAYKAGYDLIDRYRFAEAIPYFEKALTTVKLPDFYYMLASAYLDLPDLGKAEKVLRDGLELVVKKGDPVEEGRFDNLLGKILYAKGDLDGALTYASRALAIDKKVYGTDHPNVAILLNNIGQILQDKEDLDGALNYTAQALAIVEKVYGTDHPKVAIYANNIGAIFYAKKDFDGALTNTSRALAIDKKVYGTDHPKVAIYVSNIGAIFYAKGDLDSALTYTRQALIIDEKVYGPDHPQVAIIVNNIGQILKDKGYLDEALKYAKRSLGIFEKCYGVNHPSTQNAVKKLDAIKKAMAVKTPVMSVSP
jgi:tetratricopeptide (TPR) repeat protein